MYDAIVTEKDVPVRLSTGKYSTLVFCLTENYILPSKYKQTAPKSSYPGKYIGK